MNQSDITPNTSNQQLLQGDSDSATALIHSKEPRRRDDLVEYSWANYMTVAVLCFVNLINYMDRYTIAAVLGELQNEFQIGNDMAGLLQTVFVIAYMIFAPIFGYLGDRYSRRIIMASGVSLWCLTTFAGSFITNYWWFALFRCLVGIGEASYSTIAPTIISDLFIGNMRSKMLAVFYFAIPVGCGMGYVVGSTMSSALGDWRWGLRVTPILGMAAVVSILFTMEDPPRGQAERSVMKPTSYSDDLRSLTKNKSFMLSTIGFTSVAFVTGALAWWGPQFIYLGLSLNEDGKEITMEKATITFGAVTMVSGLVGVPLGTLLSARYIARWPRIHPVICGVGLLVAAPLMTLSIQYVDMWHISVVFGLMLLSEIALNLNWAIVADMALYVVIPPRRSTAEAFQILISHTFGDAGSPYIIGLVSESIKRSMTNNGTKVVSDYVQFKSLQHSLFITCFVEVLGGIFFLFTAIYIVRDKMKVDRAIAESEAQHAEPSHSNAQSIQNPVA